MSSEASFRAFVGESAPYSGNRTISSLHVLTSVGSPKVVISRSLNIHCEIIPKNYTEPCASVLLLLMTNRSVESTVYWTVHHLDS